MSSDRQPAQGPGVADARHAVVSGVSVAGLSVAYWLVQGGWRVTLLEREPAFRDGGQNVDVRGTARQVIERMGLLEQVRAHHTTETATVTVDGDGEVVAELPSDGPDGATAELEVLRGDLARLIGDALPAGCEVRYGDPIAAVEQTSHDVTLTSQTGGTLHADLLVVAEGVRSSTRDLVFGDAVQRHPLGITMAFGTIPRSPDDDDRWRWYNAVGGRQVHLRPDPYDTTRAILAYAHSDGLAGVPSADALHALRERFSDAGWQARRVLDGFANSPDVYIDDLEQIQMTTWHRDRVVLVGDAAWCVTPIGGGGASLALIGGYVLCAYLTTQPEREAALRAYAEWMRPLVDDAQKLPPGLDHFAYPQTRLGLSLRHLADKALSSPPLRPLAQRATQLADSSRELPSMGQAAPSGRGADASHGS